VNKKKIIVYPYGAEIAPCVRFLNLIENYEICDIISPKGWGFTNHDACIADRYEKIGISVKENINWNANFDAILISDCINIRILEEQIIDVMLLAIKRNIDIVYTIPSGKINLPEIISNYKHFYRYENNIRPIVTSMKLKNINTPIVFIFGLSENSNKFYLQLMVRQKLLSLCYKISQIGSRTYCEIFGFHSIPDFLKSKEYSEKEKIIGFNNYIWEIEQNEKPDIIIIGIPGGVMRESDDSCDFGIMAFLISNAVSASFSCLTMHFSEITYEYLHMLKTVLSYRYNINPDCFYLSNKYIEAEMQKLQLDYIDYVVLDNDYVIDYIGENKNILSIPVFCKTDEDEQNKLSMLIIKKLTEYGE